MTKVSIDDLKRNPEKYLQQAKDGETLVVLEDDQPVVEIKPLSQPSTEPRPYGLCRGRIQVPDDFDDPLPEEIIKLFEGA